MPRELNRLFDLSGQTVMVTGAAGQIGGLFVSALVEHGARVLAADVGSDSLARAAEAASWSKDAVLLQPVDVRLKVDFDRAIDMAVRWSGGLTGLVNNAGVSVFEPWEERTDEALDWVYEVNVKGVFNGMHAFLAHRRAQGGWGAIVNVGSLYGLVSPDPRLYAAGDRKNSEVYGATKAGVIQMTRYFAVHAAHLNVRCNVISPGGIQNPTVLQDAGFRERYAQRCPMARMGELEELAAALVFLMGPGASYVNGHNLVVDGGFTAW